MPVLLAEVTRGPLVESRHYGTLVILGADGRPIAQHGEPATPTYPRSSAKPLQLAAMLDAGLASLHLPAEALAVAAGSHGGTDRHVEWVRRILDAASLSEDDLDNTPGMPLDGPARRALIRSGQAPDRIHHNCSGKHAAMLATCRAAGWPTVGYRTPEHPVQQAIKDRIERLSGEPVTAVSVDGCGAALFAITLAGLARAFHRLVTAAPGTAEHLVSEAMRRHPDLVGGEGRDVTGLMRAVPGLVAKDGAEGVYAAAAAGIGSVAVKIDDGAARARAPVVTAALVRLGVPPEAVDGFATVPVEGHGQPVGEVRAVSAATTAAS